MTYQQPMMAERPRFGPQGKSLTDAMRLDRTVAQETKHLHEALEQIGQNYYHSFGATPHPGFEQLIANVRACQTRIEAFTKQAKAARGYVACSRCAADVPTTSPFCPACGQPIDFSQMTVPVGPIQCPYCGTGNQAGVAFCTWCANRLAAPAAPAAPTQ
jgi:hypothetical protein